MFLHPDSASPADPRQAESVCTGGMLQEASQGLGLPQQVQRPWCSLSEALSIGGHDHGKQGGEKMLGTASLNQIFSHQSKGSLRVRP
jgi:hypothetical protein